MQVAAGSIGARCISSGRARRTEPERHATFRAVLLHTALPMSESSQTDQSTPVPVCPRCQGPMWDNRESKRNPKAPDFKCKDRNCDGVIWPPRDGRSPAPAAPAPGAARRGAAPPPAAVDANGMPLCPVCGGAMWDDRASKRNPRAPDFKCRNKPRERGGPGCEGVIWPSRDGSPSPYPPPAPRRSGAVAPRVGEAPLDGPPTFDDAPPHDDDDLPF